MRAYHVITIFVQRQWSRPLSGADGGDFEANLGELGSINDETAIKDESWFGHFGIDGIPVDVAELLPLGSDDDCLGVTAGI